MEIHSEIQRQTINLKIRNFDKYENPEEVAMTIRLKSNIDYKSLKKEIEDLCQVSPETKVIKIRNKDGKLVPASFLLDINQEYFYLDIHNVRCTEPPKPYSLEEFHTEAVNTKIKNMEKRIAQAEIDLPELESRQQSYVEETVGNLLCKVAFLNRRYDELQPDYMSKMVAGTSRAQMIRGGELITDD